MNARVRRFLVDDRGAITVDWVVLCAAVLLLVTATMNVMQTGMVASSTKIATKMDEKL